MKRKRTLSVTMAALFPVIAIVLAQGCAGSGCNKKTDDEAPTASVPPPPPPPPPAPTASATMMPEEPDAGSDAGDGGPDAGKPHGGGGGAWTSISKCCAALRGNINSAPPDQKLAYMAAAQACDGMKNTPAANQAFGQIRMFLAGAKMPGACH